MKTECCSLSLSRCMAEKSLNPEWFQRFLTTVLLLIGFLFFAAQVVMADNHNSASFNQDESGEIPVEGDVERTAESTESVAERIRQADVYRSRYNSGELESSIELYRHNEKVETNRYRVQFNTNGDSRVDMLDSRSKGQRVLLLADAMWLYVPKTRKAIRITPMQRLMGQASYGDVASMRWSQEYEWDGQALSQQALADPGTANEALETLKIGLQAQRRSATYRKINLWVEAETNRPVKAEFYLASGKLMKTAWFMLDSMTTPDGQSGEYVKTTRFTVPGKDDEYTLMESINIVEKTHPDLMFTKQGLSR